MASIRCVRPIFKTFSHCLGLGREGLAALVQGRNQPLADRLGHRHVDRRGEHVVGALPHVHVVVGMDRLLRVEAIAAGQLDRPIGDHLVDVHVRRGAGAGLVDVDRELVVELALGDFAGSGKQGLDLLVAQGVLARAGQLAQVAVGHGGGPLHQGEGMDQLAGHGLAGDGEVFHGPLRLGPEIGLGRQADFAQGVVLDAMCIHVQ